MGPITPPFASGGSSTGAPTASQIAAAAQTSWYVDPVHGVDGAAGTALAPVKTALSITGRVGPAQITQPVTWYLLGPASTGDALVPPPIGPGGFLAIDASPGLTTIHSGTLTAASAQSGNAQATVTDSAIVSSWTAIGAVGARIRRTSDSAISSIANDLGSKRAGIGDAQIMPTGAFPAFGSTRTTFQTGDAYVVEETAAWPLAIVNPIACDVNGGSACKLALYAIMIAGAPTMPQLPSAAVVFYGCCMGSTAAGSFTTFSCVWEQQWNPDAGSAQYHSGAVFLTTNGTAYPFGGSDIFMSDGCVVVGSSSATDAAIVVRGQLALTGDGIGIVGSGSIDALEIAEGGIVTSGTRGLATAGKLWGSGLTGYGVRVDPGGSLVWYTGSQPTLTGTAGDLIVGGQARTWSGSTTGYQYGGASAWPSSGGNAGVGVLGYVQKTDLTNLNATTGSPAALVAGLTFTTTGSNGVAVMTKRIASTLASGTGSISFWWYVTPPSGPVRQDTIGASAANQSIPMTIYLDVPGTWTVTIYYGVTGSYVGQILAQSAPSSNALNFGIVYQDKP